MAAALLSVVSSLPPSEDAPDPDSLAAKEAQAAMEKVTTAKVKAWRKAGRKEQEKEPMKAYLMFGTTWGEGFEAPYGEISATMSNDSWEREEDRISREPTLSLPSRPRPPSPRGVCPEPVRLERGLPSRMAAPKLGLDETMELLSRVLSRDADSQRIQFEFAELAANSSAAQIRCEFSLKFLVLRIRGKFALRIRGRRQNDHACAVFSPHEKLTLNCAMQ